MLDNLLAVLAGFFTMAALTMVATNLAARLMLGARSREDMMSMTPTPPYLAVNLTFSAVFAAAGGYITGAIAGRAMGPVYALAVLMCVLGIVSYRENVRTKTSQGRWYSGTLVILGPVFALIGGWLHFRGSV